MFGSLLKGITLDFYQETSHKYVTIGKRGKYVEVKYFSIKDSYPVIDSL